MRDLAKSEDLRKAAADAGVSVDIRQLDVTDEASVAACVDGVIADYGRLDVLVNNAGHANRFATIETCTMERYRKDLEVNFFGVVTCTKHALPHLRATGGRVVSIGSTRGIIGQPFNEALSAAKFAVEGFMESLAPTVARLGVTVVIVVPGPVLGSAYGVNSGASREFLLEDAGLYAPVMEPYLNWVRDGGYPGAQNPKQVAEVVVRAITDPEPPFRVMTSDWAHEYVGKKLAEPAGTAIRAMTTSWLDPVEEAP
jgi:NAD(P)-dependent dehydrogenase (short-subunit alcohol dehydrogenase family)